MSDETEGQAVISASMKPVFGIIVVLVEQRTSLDGQEHVGFAAVHWLGVESSVVVMVVPVKERVAVQVWASPHNAGKHELAVHVVVAVCDVGLNLCWKVVSNELYNATARPGVLGVEPEQFGAAKVLARGVQLTQVVGVASDAQSC